MIAKIFLKNIIDLANEKQPWESIFNGAIIITSPTAPQFN